MQNRELGKRGNYKPSGVELVHCPLSDVNQEIDLTSGLASRQWAEAQRQAQELHFAGGGCSAAATPGS
ncbi:hypothetical protein Pcinc_014382 [Petrolisthes cinctipes]|uniref:Uncharacterized protein n=1 Tax=Petrolisthes cinctipes TaxID=88211 RepID=A0AAE1FWN3_PETCI|nr:hypothetical protein Pcinc_014382 [Petrolisthes cinctipes]